MVEIRAFRAFNDHERYAPKNIADLRANSCFVTADAEGMSIHYDFKDRIVTLEAYSLRSRYDHTINVLKSWQIEVSMDRVRWEIVDRQTNDDLKEANCVASYTLAKPVKCRYICLR